MAGRTLLLTMVEAAEELRVSRAKFYELAQRGDVPTLKIDGSRRVTRAALAEYVERLRAEQSGRSA